MPESLQKSAEDRMEKALLSLKRELSTLRAGRATPTMLDRVQVEYYGTLTPLNQLGNINTPDARTLLIQPWDKSSLSSIEKSILKSDLGLTPSNDGIMIRLNIPPLTEERRADLVKMTKRYGEDSKIAIRNIRRDIIEELKKMEKSSDLSEDESRRNQEQMQKTTDRFIAEVDKILLGKEKEIMEV
jgi:ribosome recycling factor